MTSSSAPPQIIHVVAAAVVRRDGRVLIAQRPPGKPLAGGWEFPGGKLEPRETRRAGLARELCEELGIAIRTPRPLTRVSHAYPYGEVLIDMWVVSRYDGEPRGMDGQALRWCGQEELAASELLPADRPLVRALRLPERLREPVTEHYEVTAARTTAVLATAARTTAAPGIRTGKLRGLLCSGMLEGLRWAPQADFLVMEGGLEPRELEHLCERVAQPVYARGPGLEAAWALGATGVSELAP